MDLSQTKINTTAERDGIWVDFDDETSFLIARWMNPKHKGYIQNALKPYTRQYRTGDIPQDISDRIEAQSMAECILLDWRGLMHQGQEVPFSKGEALKLLQDESQSWIRAWIMQEAQNLLAYQVQQLEEAVENVGES